MYMSGVDGRRSNQCPRRRKGTPSCEGHLEAALNRTEHEETPHRYHKVLETVAGTVFTTDVFGRFTLVTDSSVEAVGGNLSELIGHHVMSVFAPEDADRWPRSTTR